MVRWEYKVCNFSAKEEEYELNLLGKDGWELCSVLDNTQGAGICSSYYLKRPMTVITHRP